MNKVKKLTFLSITVLFAMVIIVLFSISNSIDKAYAYDFSSLSEIEISGKSDDINLEYDGENKEIFVTLNYAVDEIEYQWYKSNTIGGTGVLVNSGKTEGNKVALLLKDLKDNGYYVCRIIKLKAGAAESEVNLMSESILVAFSPKTLKVSLKSNKFTYSSNWIEPEFIIDKEDIYENDDVGQIKYTSNKPLLNAGEYTIEAYCENENYEVISQGEGSNPLSSFNVIVNPSPLKIKVKEITITEKVASDKGYNLTVIYDGFLGQDTITDLGFSPYIESKYTSYKKAGIYDVKASGSKTGIVDNYDISYPTSKLYINYANLAFTSQELKGTISGSIKTNTDVSIDSSNALKLKFYEFKVNEYSLNVKAGGIDSETYTINLEDYNVSNILLGIRMYDKEGNRIEVNRFNYDKDNKVLSIQIKGKFEGTFVLYRSFLLIYILAAFIIIIVIITLICWAKSKRKYETKQYIYDTAHSIAKKMNKK